MPNTMNFLIVTIAAVYNKLFEKNFADLLHGRLNLLSKMFKHIQWVLTVIHEIESKL